MFGIYLKIALRNLAKHKLFSFINIMGFALGIAACILVFSFVKYELGYDDFQKDGDRVYRVTLEAKSSKGLRKFVVTSFPLASALKDNYSQIENSVRIKYFDNLLVQKGDKKFFEGKFLYTESQIFEILTIPFIKGKPQQSLENVNSVVITEQMAQKYFGDKEPLGQILNIDNYDRTVTGVVKNSPHNSHIHYDCFLPIYPFQERNSGHWGVLTYHTYITVKNDVDMDQLQRSIAHIADKYIGKDLEKYNETRTYYLQPIKDIYLHSDFPFDEFTSGNFTNIIIFSCIALLILLIACFNFINLSTAKSLTTEKQLGMRKVIGAQKYQIIFQFLVETVIISLFSLMSAMIISFLLLSSFNHLVNRPVDTPLFLNKIDLAFVILFTLVTGVLAGLFPAIKLSATLPIPALKGSLSKGKRGTGIRRGLVIFQFVIFSVLIVAGIIVYNQLVFLKNQNTGFDKEQIVVLKMVDHVSSGKLRRDYQQIKTEFTNHHAIQSATVTSMVPGVPQYAIAKMPVKIYDDDQQLEVGMNHLMADFDFIDTYNISIKAGRAFDKEMITDSKTAYIVNEAAAKACGWASAEQAIGKKIQSRNGPEGIIIGVLNDFNYRSLHYNIEPMVLRINPGWFVFLSLKIKLHEIPEALDFLEKKWQQYFSHAPFDYFFLDTYFNRQYEADMKIEKIIFAFTGLAIFLACLGLFGLSYFNSTQRTKEIGVRKILGASVINIVFLFFKDYMRWIVIANLVAMPITCYIMTNWLQNYAYRIGFSWLFFAFSFLLSLGVVFVTVFAQTARTALSNPVNSLRYE